MTTAYTKTPVGNKQFVIQWDLSIPDDVSSDVGDTFEAVDCELISIHATTLGAGALTKLSYGNKNSVFVAINLSVPDNNIVISPPFPSVRFYSPSLEEAEATASIALLFREI